MGLLGFIKGQLIDVIDWLDDSGDTLVWRFPDGDNEIKNGAKLTVREGQVAVFVSEGQIGDVFGPGLYTLTTQNIPVLTSLQSWKYGFNSPFKAEVYFINTRQYPDLKWGTKNPIMLRDADFGAVRLRAFGTYAIRVSQPSVFLKEIVGTDGHYSTDDIEDTLKSRLVSAFTHMLGEAKVPALDLASNYRTIGDKAQSMMSPDFEALGLSLTKFIIENISLPPNLEKALDKRGEVGIMGGIGQYTQVQAASAMMAAAENPNGGLAGAGVGLGAGMMMGQQFAGAMGQPMMGQPMQQPPAMAAPPPMPQFYANIGGQQAGPFGMPQLQQYVGAGQLTAQSLVWTQGMANWLPAGQVPQLGALFAAPPPMPGAPPPMPSAPPAMPEPEG